jgi:signal transduction histidine kinase/CheY-like chemotaxis protein
MPDHPRQPEWSPADANVKENDPLARQARAALDRVLDALASLPEDSSPASSDLHRERIEIARVAAVDAQTHLERLCRAREEAEAASRAKDDFIAMTSHELRTPLGAILIWAQLLKTEEMDPGSVSRAVGMIERSTKNLAQLIDDLLDASRIIAGKLTFEKRPLDLTGVVEAAFESIAPAAAAKGITVKKSIERVLPPVSGDPGRLQQVVANLLSNAVKFTPEQGRVELRVERAGSEVRVSVADTGAGIPADFLPILFERFRQADSTTTRKQKGLGLGLAIARHLVEQHGGVINAASEGEGRGSVFTVTLPFLHDVEEPPGPRRAEEPPGALSLAGVRVLVVDDEEDARDAMVVLLGQAGARVQSVASAAEALESLADYRPDVLLSDIAMPGEDGYALIRRIRALPAELGGRVPAAALTAYATLEDRARALRAGFDEHIPKPVEPARLIGAVAILAGELRPSSRP